MPPSNRPKATKYTFSEQYREQVFYFWYGHREMGLRSFNAQVPADIETGRKADFSTAKRWMDEYDWITRAEALDVETALRMDNMIIDERIAMFREHAEIGKKIREMGLQFLESNGLEKDASALRAIADGIQIERSSRGLADALAKIATMDDASLSREINKLLPQAIDANYEDITDDNSDT